MVNQLFQICQDGIVGRHLVASQNIETGSVVVQEAPLVCGPFLYTIPVCLACYKTLNEKNCRPCSTCGWPLCNDKCEKSLNHQPECILTAARGHQISIKNFGIPNPNYQFVSILRALYLKKTNQEKWDKLLNLQSHKNSNLAPASFISKFFQLKDWNEDEIEHVGGVLMVNGHELPFTQPPQLVVYEEVSFLEHNCRANCSKTFTDNGEIKIVASENIKKGDHLSICYTDAFWGVENRRLHLHQSKNFWCSCSRCQDSTELGTHINSIKCPKKSCSGLVLPKTFLEDCTVWNCNTCDSLFPQETIGIILNKIGEELSSMVKEDATVCKDFIRTHEKVLAPNHYYLLDVKIVLCYMLGNQNLRQLSNADLQLLHDLTLTVKEVIDQIAPAERRILGATLYRLAQSKMELARRSKEILKIVVEESKELLVRARDLLSQEPSRLQEGRIYRQMLLDPLLENC